MTMAMINNGQEDGGDDDGGAGDYNVD